MKIVIKGVEVATIIPENDSDEAILWNWSGKFLRVDKRSDINFNFKKGLYVNLFTEDNIIKQANENNTNRRT